MSHNWTLRWFAMLILFALSTVAFSSYAGASAFPISPHDAPTETDVDGR